METIIENEDTLGTPIQEFFRGTNVFITGGTGFMGRVLVEKILRSCPHVARVYLLVRTKKDIDPQKRLNELFDDCLFAKIGAKSRNKLEVINGDCLLPGLGISEHHRSLLKEKINIIIHAAATVRFDEPLPLAVAINVSGTKEILQLAHEITDLRSIVHVSTAFANCHLKDISEKIYDVSMSSEDLIKITGCVSEDILHKVTPFILQGRPNTYVYTKSVAEDLVRKQSKGLPLAIFRPAIVVATNSEPIPGWINNIYSLTGIVTGVGVGLLRILCADKNKLANIVPVDMACNAIIATAWDAAQRETIDNKEEEELPQEPPVYNYVSSVEKPLTWSRCMDLTFKHGFMTPPSQLIWYPNISLHTSHLMYKLSIIYLHLFPAIFIDLFARLLRKPANMVKIYRKVKNFSEITKYFAMRIWNFDNSNVQKLWKTLDQKDQEIFPFSIANINWDNYFYHYVRGVRLYILKDDPSTIPQAIVKLKRFYWLHQVTKCLIGFCILTLAWFIIMNFLIQQ